MGDLSLNDAERFLTSLPSEGGLGLDNRELVNRILTIHRGGVYDLIRAGRAIQRVVSLFLVFFFVSSYYFCDPFPTVLLAPFTLLLLLAGRPRGCALE